jgi:hypothetical protein
MIKTIIGFLAGSSLLILVGWFVFNGAMMLFWPARWFSLPRWLTGPFQKDRFNTRDGRFEARYLGFWALVASLWILSNLLSPRDESGTGNIGQAVKILWAIGALVGVSGFGVVMLFKAKVWIEKFFFSAGVQKTENDERTTSILASFLRVTGVLFTALAVYTLWSLLHQ